MALNSGTRVQSSARMIKRTPCRVVMRPVAASLSEANSAHQAPKYRLLGSISKAVELQGATSKFETLAGRSAMLGTITALVVESFTEESLVGASGLVDSTAMAGLVAGVMATASAVAALQTSATAPRLLEAVITSLTAAQRSKSSYMQAQVDSVVDDVVLATFNTEMLLAFTEFESLTESEDELYGP